MVSTISPWVFFIQRNGYFTVKRSGNNVCSWQTSVNSTWVYNEIRVFLIFVHFVHLKFTFQKFAITTQNVLHPAHQSVLENMFGNFAHEMHCDLSFIYACFASFAFRLADYFTQKMSDVCLQNVFRFSSLKN